MFLVGVAQGRHAWGLGPGHLALRQRQRHDRSAAASSPLLPGFSRSLHPRHQDEAEELEINPEASVSAELKLPMPKA